MRACFVPLQPCDQKPAPTQSLDEMKEELFEKAKADMKVSFLIPIFMVVLNVYSLLVFSSFVYLVF